MVQGAHGHARAMLLLLLLLGLQGGQLDALCCAAALLQAVAALEVPVHVGQVCVCSRTRAHARVCA
jgi:putative effector of murein hydrolase LrgA (UPF0299 family)